MTAIGELFLEALTDEEAVVGVDCQVAGVEKRVEVRAEKQSISDLMPSPVRWRLM